ncbi:MAG TPA: hypothetical protein VF503_00100 [Sphingobium sp.]|uniref:hypothetical protein n=1 Tax=Sphingobium sp. TaxID=1912891 RepID=UPI002ED4C982
MRRLYKEPDEDVAIDVVNPFAVSAKLGSEMLAERICALIQRTAKRLGPDIPPEHKHRPLSFAREYLGIRQ